MVTFRIYQAASKKEVPTQDQVLRLVESASQRSSVLGTQQNPFTAHDSALRGEEGERQSAPCGFRVRRSGNANSANRAQPKTKPEIVPIALRADSKPRPNRIAMVGDRNSQANGPLWAAQRKRFAHLHSAIIKRNASRR